MDYSDPNIKSLSEPARNILLGLETFKCDFEYDELKIILPLLSNLQALKFYWAPYNNHENILGQLRNLKNLTELNLLACSHSSEEASPFNTNDFSDILSACNHLTRLTFAICKSDVKWSELSEAALKTLAKLRELDIEQMETSEIRKDILFIFEHAKHLNKIVLPIGFSVNNHDLSSHCFYQRDFERLKKLLAS